MLPLTIAGRKGDDGLGQAARRHGRARRPPRAQARRALAAASSSASPSPARSHRAPRSSSPTSPPATSTRAPARRSSHLLRRSCDDLGQTIVMVTHDAARRHLRRPHRLPQGRPDRPRLRPPGRDDDLRRHQVAGGRARDPHRLAQPHGAQAAHDPHDAGHPARRRHDQRHLRAHRPDRQGFKQIFTDAYKGIDVTVARKAAFTGDMTSARRRACRESLVATRSRRVPGVGRGRRLRHRHAAPSPSTARSWPPAVRRRCSSRTRPTRSSCSPTPTCRARRPRESGEVGDHREARHRPEAGGRLAAQVITPTGTQTVTRVGRLHLRRAVVAGRLAHHRHDAGRRAEVVRHGRAGSRRST